MWRTEIAGNKLHRVSDEWPAFLGKLIQWVIALMQQAEKPAARVLGDDALLDELVDSLVDEVDVQERSFGETADELRSRGCSSECSPAPGARSQISWPRRR